MQACDHGERRVGGIQRSEDDLELRVLLMAERAQLLVEPGLGAAQWLQRW